MLRCQMSMLFALLALVVAERASADILLTSGNAAFNPSFTLPL